jgi:hypothetical protein
VSHGGKRDGAGHPVTTGSASTPPVFYRVSAAQHAELVAEGKRRKMTPNAVAKQRAFP